MKNIKSQKAYNDWLKQLKTYRQAWPEWDQLEKLVKNLSFDIVEEYYPEIRLIAAEVTILIGEENKNKCGHAVVILIDMRGQKYENWTVEYFDSSGAPPVKEFIPLLGDIASALRDYRKKLKQSGDVKILPVTAMVRHQLTTTECGMHALIYIRRRLEGISAEMFSRYKIPDALAKGFRRDIFVE